MATTDSFTGLNSVSTFTLGADSNGNPMDTYSVSSISLRLNGIESYVGGSESDSYVINRAYTGNLSGGGGANSFTINAAVTGNVTSGEGNDVINIAAVVTGNVDAGGGGDTVRLQRGGRIVGSLALGETSETTNSVDTLDLSMFGSPLTIIYSELGGSAYAADNTYGMDMDTEADAVIMSDGHATTGMPNPGPTSGIFGAERLIGAAHVVAEGGTASSGTYLVVQPAGNRYATDLAINGTADALGSVPVVSLMLPDLSMFPGHVLLGGSGAPPFPINGPSATYLPLSVPGVNTNPSDSDLANDMTVHTVVQARRLIIAGDVELPGSLVIMGSSVFLLADVATGVTGDDMTSTMTTTDSSSSELAIIATGGATDADENNAYDGDGFVTNVLASMERERNISADHAFMAVRRTFSNAITTVVNLESGRLQFAQGNAGIVLFNPSSRFIGITAQPEIDSYIRQRLGLTLNTLVLSVFNPASDLTQTATLFIDTSLFEQDLTLFSLIGKGISLYLSLCEEIEGCAPPVELEEIDDLLRQARERLAELKQRLEGAGGSAYLALTDSIRRFEKVVRDLSDLRQEFVEIFGEGRYLPPGDNIYEVSVPPWEYMLVAQSGTGDSDD